MHLLLFALPLPALACIRYSATYPFSPSLPFSATITDNNTVTCWISRTYNTHNRLQQLANQSPAARAEVDEVTWGFKRWDFTCLEGFEGWANVGVRTVGYKSPRRGGKVVQWVCDMQEDIFGEEWVYWKEVGCEEERKAAEERVREEKKRREDEERRKKEEEMKEEEEGRKKKEEEEKRKKEEVEKEARDKKEKLMRELEEQEEKRRKEADAKKDVLRKRDGARKRQKMDWEREMNKME